MFLELMMVMFYFFFILFNCNNFFYSNLLFIYSIIILLKLNYLNWWLMIYEFSFNKFSVGLVILSLWILGLVVMNLIKLKMLKKCLLMLNLMFIIMIFNFMTMNFLLFYYLFEVSLLLVYYLIMNWGYGKLKILSSYLLVFYTLMFSFPMLFIIMYMYNNYNSLSFLILELMNLNLMKLMLILLIFGFLVKIPMFFMHGWLLKAHVESPFFGSMILAAIMLKLGGYGLMRMMMIFYKMIMEFNYIFMSISLIGILLMSIFCLRQVDMKVLVAMSSVVHMGLMISSMMMFLKMSFFGSYLMMLSHGLSSSGLFYMINIIYSETKSRLMLMNKGFIMLMPSMSMMWFLMCSSNMAAPVSLNLISEIYLLTSLLLWMKLLIFILILYCLLSFIYSIYLFMYINHGKFDSLNYYMNLSNLLMFITVMIHWFPLNLIILIFKFII